MGSACSRTRTRLKRKSASRCSCRKFRPIRRRPNTVAVKKVLNTAYASRKYTSPREMPHSTLANATSWVAAPSTIMEKYSDCCVKALMSSAMRWSGLSSPATALSR